MANRRKSSLSRTSLPYESQDEDASDPYSLSFDPNTFKVVQLRALLSQHDIAVPSNARKADLIRAYEEGIRANSEELKAARNRDRNIRPSAEGVTILNADGFPVFKEESSGNESELPPPSLSRSGISRRGRRSVSWAEDVSGPEDDEEAVGDASTFSINNPFQSPPPQKVPRKTEPGPKRPSSESKARQPRSSTSSILRDYMDPSIALNTPPRIIGNTASKIKGRVAEISGLKQEQDYDESGMEADLSRDAYDDPPTSPAAQKKKRNRGKQSNLSEEDDDSSDSVQAARGITWLLIVVLGLSWWVWFASESRTVGFCDMASRSNALLDERVREQAISQKAIDDGDERANVTLRVPLAFRPTCLPCPPHAVCKAGAMVGCESSDYALRIPLMAHLPLVSTLIPLSMTSPSCQPDQQKVLLAADLADEIENRLRVWKGDVQCKREMTRFGPAKSEKERSSDGIFALPKKELYQDLKEEIEKGSALAEHPDEYYQELWSLAMEDLHATNRIGEEYRGQATLYSKRGGVGIGWGCNAKLLVENAWQRMRLWVATFCLLLLTVQWLRHRLQSNRIRRGQTKELVAATLSRLEEVKRHSIKGKNNQDGFLSITQLRDDILRKESLESRKKKIWTLVAKVVESNTNVRTRQAKVRGEWSRVWEWIGALDAKKEIDSSDAEGLQNDHKVVNRGNGRIHSAEI